MSVITPKDFQKRAQKALAASPFYALRELQVEREGDALLILGQVSSFYHKQLAQEVVLAMAKAKAYRVVNSIEVIDTLTM